MYVSSAEGKGPICTYLITVMVVEVLCLLGQWGF